MSLLLDWLESMHVDMKVTNKCSRKRNLRSTCHFCIGACKNKAISNEHYSIEINSEQCTSCGDCMVACPLSAIEGIAISREFKHSQLLYHDSYIPSEKELLIYKKRGMKGVKSETSINSYWEQVLDETNKKLFSLGEGMLSIEQGEEKEKLTRRALFSTVKMAGKQAIKNLAPAVWKIEAEEWKLSTWYPGYQFYSVELNHQVCSLCQACFSICTENVFVSGEEFLKIENEKCVNCMDCRDICSEQAITITPNIQPKVEQQFKLYMRKCSSCSRVFPSLRPDDSMCHICASRDPEWLSPYQ